MDKYFELEQNLLQCWNVVDDIKLVTNYILENPECGFMPTAVQDKVSNMLIGISIMYQLKFEKAMESLETVMREKYESERPVDI